MIASQHKQNARYMLVTGLIICVVMVALVLLLVGLIELVGPIELVGLAALVLLVVNLVDQLLPCESSCGFVLEPSSMPFPSGVGAFSLLRLV